MQFSAVFELSLPLSFFFFRLLPQGSPQPISNLHVGLSSAQLWWNYKKCTMKRLLTTYHNVFKMSISMSKYESTSLLCTVFNVLCCQAVIRNLVYRFMCRLQASNNSLVMSIQSSSLVYTSRIRKHWRRLLYVNG